MTDDLDEVPEPKNDVVPADNGTPATEYPDDDIQEDDPSAPHQPVTEGDPNG